MQVRVLEAEDHPTRLTLAARPACVGLPAEQHLSEPQCQALLADAGRAVDEKRCGKLTGLERAQQRLPYVLVPLHGVYSGACHQPSRK